MGISGQQYAMLERVAEATNDLPSMPAGRSSIQGGGFN
jgi:hypothetical protein